MSVGVHARTKRRCPNPVCDRQLVYWDTGMLAGVWLLDRSDELHPPGPRRSP